MAWGPRPMQEIFYSNSDDFLIWYIFIITEQYAIIWEIHFFSNVSKLLIHFFHSCSDSQNPSLKYYLISVSIPVSLIWHCKFTTCTLDKYMISMYSRTVCFFHLQEVIRQLNVNTVPENGFIEMIFHLMFYLSLLRKILI